MDSKTASSELNLVVAKNNDVQVNGTNIRLNLIKGFENLTDRQQRYLQEYATEPDHKTLHAMQLGYTTGEVNSWFTEPEFSDVAETIYDIYTEVLKGIDFRDAIGNSKIRARVIKAREQGGKYNDEKKGTVHNHLHTGENLSDVLKMLKD